MYSPLPKTKSTRPLPAYLGKEKETRFFCARKKLPSSVLFSIRMDGGAYSNAYVTLKGAKIEKSPKPTELLGFYMETRNERG